MNRKIIFRGWNIKYKCWDYVNNPMEDCNVLELVDNFGFLISFFFDKFIC